MSENYGAKQRIYLQIVCRRAANGEGSPVTCPMAGGGSNVSAQSRSRVRPSPTSWVRHAGDHFNTRFPPVEPAAVQ
ncbi:hypothetical protein J6590_073022 [Homalodisca vitripennis]|nr:hypothetical protein J6590_073022 [Homalodisca vitripennis]